MTFSYGKLWDLAIDRNMNKTQVRDATGITSATLARLSKNQPVSMDSLGRICKYFKCNICDIVDYIDEVKVSE